MASVFGVYIALLIAYYIGKKIGAPGIERIVGKKTYQKIYNHKFGAKWFMFISALTPIPYIPYLVGLWQFSLKDTLFYVVLPRTIRIIILFVFTYYLGIVFFK